MPEPIHRDRLDGTAVAVAVFCCAIWGGNSVAVKYAIPVKHVLLDNGVLGKISKEQRAGSYPVWQTSLVNPDFAEYARLCGAVGIPVHHAHELDAGMKSLFAADGPALLHVHTDAELV